MDFKDNLEKKFVCPSDRQLALRAKLRTGWSTTKSNGPLKPEEQAAIIAVIRRNEDIEIAERQRIGRLVERVEKIKQRAAEYGPQYCRLCGVAFGLLGPSKLLCEDCQKPVCNKCSIEISTTKGYRSREIWLCKICSETREMWKKSGAWFYKGLPYFENSSKIQNNLNKINEEPIKSPIKTTKLGMEIENSSENDTDSENDELSQNQDNLRIKNHRKSSIISRTESFRIRTIGSIRKFSTTLFFNRQHSSNPNDTVIELNNSEILNNDDLDGNNDKNRIRHGSISSSLCASETQSQSSSQQSNELTINSSFHHYHNQNYQLNQQMCREPPLGYLELSLTYNETYNTLDCIILRARDLPPMDNTDLADPFCKLNIITPQKLTKQLKWLRTRTFHKTRNPEMNEQITFMGVEPEELDNSLLYIVFLDDDKYGHDFLGTAKVRLTPVQNLIPYRITVPLETEDQFSIEAVSSEPWSRGQILIALSYKTKKRSLVVNIKRCVNLIPMDNNGSSDPFIKLQLKPDSHRKKYKTNVKWHNLNPIFNEEFQFETRPNDLYKQSLIITVWDKDIGKSNDFLGSLVIGYNSKGRRLKQWMDCVRLPDYYHEQWHYLSSELPSH